MFINVEKVHEKSIIPKSQELNLGFDLHIVSDGAFYRHYEPGEEISKRYVLGPGEKRLFKTGLKMAIPSGFGVLLRDRSGLAAKHGLHVLAGVIDSSYRGEWMICIVNLGKKPYQFVEGDRIAQGIIVPDYFVQFNEVESLDKTERGESGFGSTGR